MLQRCVLVARQSDYARRRSQQPTARALDSLHAIEEMLVELRRDHDRPIGFARESCECPSLLRRASDRPGSDFQIIERRLATNVRKHVHRHALDARKILRQRVAHRPAFADKRLGRRPVAARVPSAACHKLINQYAHAHRSVS